METMKQQMEMETVGIVPTDNNVQVNVVVHVEDNDDTQQTNCQEVKEETKCECEPTPPPVSPPCQIVKPPPPCDGSEKLPCKCDCNKCVDCVQRRSPVDLYYGHLMDNLCRIIGDGELTTLNIIAVCVNLMQIVETYPNMCGKDKKALVIKVLECYCHDHHCDEGMIVMIPGFIDTTIELDKGQMKIAMDVEDVAECCVGLCGAFLRSRRRDRRCRR